MTAEDLANDDDGDQGAEEPEVPPNAPEATTSAPPVDTSDPNVVSVATDDNGDGSGQFGYEPSKIANVEAPQGGKATFGESHSVGITRVDLTGSPVKNGTASVRVILK